MSCTLTAKLISQSQEGDIGEDWRYDLDVRVSSGDQKGRARFKVPKHNLQSGMVQEPHGAPQPQTVFAGDCSDELKVEMRLVATEVDMFVNDVGKIRCAGRRIRTRFRFSLWRRNLRRMSARASRCMGPMGIF